MQLAVDLHSHSGYAGGVGQIPLEAVAQTMHQKGIHVFGSGDCLLPARMQELQSALHQTAEGLFSLPRDDRYFLLQTEVIFSTRLPGYRNKTIAHHVVLFPHFAAVEAMQKLMQKWGMKNTIGRPFITSNSQKELEDQLWAIAAIDPAMEIIPAHVLTPDGIYGSKNNLSELTEFYGNFLPRIHAVETGLSADPAMLARIPDLAQLTFLSNSDCHSAALNRIGREFTILDTTAATYPTIIAAIRNNAVAMTAEFNPAEGRYFLTGHRANRPHHKHPLWFDQHPPEDLRCPVCHKPMLLGVKQRAQQLSDSSIIPHKRQFMHLIPLVEVIAHGLGIKSVTSQKVVALFQTLMSSFPSEIALWQHPRLADALPSGIPDTVIQCILAVQKNRFTFSPAGFDGTYGILHIG